MSVILLRYFNPVGAHPSGLIGEQPTESPTNLMPCVVDAAFGNRKELRVYGSDYSTPDGTCIRDYIHIMDLAEGHMSALKYAMEHTGAEIFNLGTGCGTSVLELLETFSRVNQVRVPMPSPPGAREIFLSATRTRTRHSVYWDGRQSEPWRICAGTHGAGKHRRRNPQIVLRNNSVHMKNSNAFQRKNGLRSVFLFGAKCFHVALISLPFGLSWHWFYAETIAVPFFLRGNLAE